MAFTQDEETQYAVQGSDPRPVDDCGWCGDFRKPKEDCELCPTCRDLEENHGWSAGTYAKQEVWFQSSKRRKEGHTRLRSKKSFIETSTHDLLPAATDNDSDDSGGKEGDNPNDTEEREKDDADDMPAGEKRKASDSEEESEGEGGNKSRRVTLSPVGLPAGVELFTTDDEEALSREVGVASTAELNAYAKKLKDRGYNDDKVAECMAEVCAHRMDLVSQQNNSIMLRVYALPGTAKWADEVGPKLSKLQGDAQNADAYITHKEGRLRALQSAGPGPTDPEDVEYEDQLKKRVEEKTTALKGMADEMDELKGSVQEKFEELNEKGKKRYKVTLPTTPEKARKETADVRASEFGNRE